MDDKEALRILLSLAVRTWALNTHDRELKTAIHIVESLASIYPDMTQAQLTHVRRVHEEHQAANAERFAQGIETVEKKGESRGPTMLDLPPTV